MSLEPGRLVGFLKISSLRGVLKGRRAPAAPFTLLLNIDLVSAVTATSFPAREVWVRCWRSEEPDNDGLGMADPDARGSGSFDGLGIPDTERFKRELCGSSSSMTATLLHICSLTASIRSDQSCATWVVQSEACRRGQGTIS